MFGYGFCHRLLILSSAPLFIDRVRPQHLAGTTLNKLDGDATLVFDPGAICEQATCDLAAGRFLLNLNRCCLQYACSLGWVGHNIYRNFLLSHRCRKICLEAVLRLDIHGSSSKLGSKKRTLSQRLLLLRQSVSCYTLLQLVSVHVFTSVKKLQEYVEPL